MKFFTGIFAILFVTNAIADTTITITGNTNPTPTQVTATWAAESVTEIEVLKVARIVKPKLVFSSDFGLGTEAWVYATGSLHSVYTDASNEACKGLGYGKRVGLEEGYQIPEGQAMVYRVTYQNGLSVAKMPNFRSAAIITCSLTK